MFIRIPRLLRRIAVAGLLGAGLLLAASAHADVWGYVDERGVAHFASEKLDARYELFFRGNPSFDTAQGVPALAPAPADEPTPRPVAVPTQAAKLIAYFQIAPGYKQVQHHVREAARTHRLDVELLQALIATESGFDAQAVSPKGAVGLMQVMPTTAQRWGVQAEGNVSVHKKLIDPQINIRTGSRYLRHLIDLFPGQLELALAAYNAGEGAVQRAGNRIPNYRETQNYVRTVMQLYAMLKPPAAVMGAARASGPAAPPESGAPPRRVRMELPGAVAGRANMPPPLGAAAASPLSSAPTPGFSID